MLSRKFNQKIADIASDAQLKYYNAWCDGEDRSYRQIAKDLGCGRTSVMKGMDRLEKRATSKNLLAPYCPTNGVGAGRILGPVTHHVKNGEIVQEWPRTVPEAGEVEKNIKLMVEELCEGIKGKSEIVKPPICTSDDLMSLYCLFDRHIGMYAWSEETGDDNYNLKLAEELEISTITDLVNSQPATGEAVFVLGSDFFHAENDDQVTPQHKNKLEVDGRSAKVFKTGVMIAINAITTALMKHNTIRVEVIPGNHDPVSSKHMMTALWVYYSNNPRVNVVETYGLFAYYKFGNTLLAFQHGDKAKHQDMYNIITTDRREDWSSVSFVDAYSGHFHTNRIENIGIVQFESVPTPIPRDAHSSTKWRSRRAAHAITYSKEKGMVGRTVKNFG